MDDGNRLEDAIAQWYHDQHAEWLLSPSDTIRHAEHDWCLANPDRLVYADHGLLHHGLEIKRRYSRDGWGEPHTDDVPDDVACQCHWYMFVTGLPRWDVAVRWEGSGYGEYVLLADADIQAGLFEQVRAFWHDHVLAKVPPDPGPATADGHCIAAIFPFREDRIFDADEEEDGLAYALLMARKAYDKAKADKDEAENAFKAAIRDRGGLRGWWGRVTWRPTKAGHRTLRCHFKENL